MIRAEEYSKSMNSNNQAYIFVNQNENIKWEHWKHNFIHQSSLKSKKTNQFEKLKYKYCISNLITIIIWNN